MKTKNILLADGHINTYSGKKLNLLDPSPDDINIHDIARGLAFNSHFGGQTPHFFSIAQHCLMVCNFMEEAGHDNPELLMSALLHDASEAYLGDMVKPLKVLLPAFQKIETGMMQVIYNKYQLPIEHMALIKPYDREAQELEYISFYKKGPVIYHLLPEEALKEFKSRFYRYINRRISEKTNVPWTSTSL